MAEQALNLAKSSQKARAVVENVNRVIVGKSSVVRQAVTALLAEGHILLEDVPGIGKTMLARALACSISGNFKRIQFTADLLPSDITGVNIYRQQDGEFVFKRGPLFCNILLGDEINRATPRTQSSLLEAMEEQQSTVDGERYPVERPFFVIATQNPIELEGTYPLPFAQLDRFMVRLSIGYLNATDECDMLKSRINASPIEDLESVISCDELVELQKNVQLVKITDDLLGYVVAIARATRTADVLDFGASPRASLDMVRYAQAAALLEGRDYVLPDDVKSGAVPILTHRVVVRRGTRHGTMSTGDKIKELVENVPVPV